MASFRRVNSSCPVPFRRVNLALHGIVPPSQPLAVRPCSTESTLLCTVSFLPANLAPSRSVPPSQPRPVQFRSAQPTSSCLPLFRRAILVPSAPVPPSHLILSGSAFVRTFPCNRISFKSNRDSLPQRPAPAQFPFFMPAARQPGTAARTPRIPRTGSRQPTPSRLSCGWPGSPAAYRICSRRTGPCPHGKADCV